MLPIAPPPSFYGSRADLNGPPGIVLDRIELQAPDGLRGWAILYRSTGLDGRPVATSGLVLAPTEPVPAPPIVAWAHGTTGIADACAPSREGLVSLTVPGLVDLPRLGYVVTATDYEGLGTPGLHPYLIGPSEGRAVLDSIRAAATLVEASVESRAAVVGISQGGHAALWSGELQPGHAPEIALLGIVAASPPMDLRSVQDAVLGGPSPSVSPGAGGGDGAADPRAASWLETLLVVAAWHELLGAPIDGLLTDEGRNIVAALARECPWTMDGPHAYPFQTDPRSIPAWQELLEANSPGHAPSRAPIFILAATADEQVAPSTIPVGIDRLRAVGSTVELRWVDGGHTSTVTEPAAMALVLDWLRDRFRR